jgi:hypothetical protein
MRNDKADRSVVGSAAFQRNLVGVAGGITPGYHLLSRCDKAGLQTPNGNAITTEPANQRHSLREKRIVDKLVGDCGQGSVSGADQSVFRERKQLFFVVPESFLVFVRRASH